MVDMSPPNCAAPATLAQTMVANYHRDGFVVEDEVFSSDEIAALRQAVDNRALDHVDRVGSRTLHHLALTTEHQLFRDLACDERIHQRLSALIGPNIVLQHSKLAAKPTRIGAGPFLWHQDFAYYPHTNTDLLSVMVMLDDATLDNGCMEIVPGSHRLGLLDHADEDGFFSGGCQCKELWEAPGATVAITPRAGGISIHHTLTLHGSGPNRSGRPRRGLVFSYRAADAYQLADQVFPDTGTVVCGQYAEHARCEAMTLRLPRFRHRLGTGTYGNACHQVGDVASGWNRERGLHAVGAAPWHED
jgi:phytanoyl-CoA hydroxylase